METLWMITLALMVASVSPALAGDSPSERVTLAGLKGVYVIVEKMDADAERDGLTHSILQTDVELKLRQSGIRVLTATEWLAAPGGPHLYLNVNAMRGGAGRSYAYCIHLELVQQVWLSRDPTMRTTATTWSSGEVGTVGAANLSTIRDSVRDKVDQFLNAYLSANPHQ